MPAFRRQPSSATSGRAWLLSLGLLLAPGAGADEPPGLWLRVLGETEFVAGQPAVLRAQVDRGVDALCPAPSAEAEVELWAEPAGGVERLLARGRSDARGGLELRFRAPAEGRGELIVRASGPEGSAALRRPWGLRPAEEPGAWMHPLLAWLLRDGGRFPQAGAGAGAGVRLGLPGGGEARVGERLRVSLEAPGDLPQVFVELVQAGRVLASQAVALRAGRAEASLVLESGGQGLASLRAYGLGTLGPIPGQTMELAILPREPLEVRLSRREIEARAGELLGLRLQVLGDSGRPRRARLSVGFGRAEEVVREAEPELAAPPLWDGPARALERSLAASVAEALERYGQENQAWWRVGVLDEARDAWRPPEDVLGRLVLRGLLAEEAARDPWGRPWELVRLEHAFGGGRLRFLALASRGLPEAPAELWAPLGEVGAPGRPGALRASGGPRTWALETDEDGQVEFDLPLPALPGPGLIGLVAQGEDGALGWSHHRLEILPAAGAPAD
jgi:hypothetical protein